ncbi:MAG: hypothetical protein ABI574_12225, partial [Burkholderiales bacterium]
MPLQHRASPQQPELPDPARVQAAQSIHQPPSRFIGMSGSKKPGRSPPSIASA